MVASRCVFKFIPGVAIDGLLLFQWGVTWGFVWWITAWLFICDLNICHKIIVAWAPWGLGRWILAEIWSLWLLTVDRRMVKRVDGVTGTWTTLLELNLLISESAVDSRLNPETFIKVLETISLIKLDNLDITPMQMPMFILVRSFSIYSVLLVLCSLRSAWMSSSCPIIWVCGLFLSIASKLLPHHVVLVRCQRLLELVLLSKGHALHCSAQVFLGACVVHLIKIELFPASFGALLLWGETHFCVCELVLGLRWGTVFFFQAWLQGCYWLCLWC